ncbi:MAG: hypothetical protein ACKV2U_01460 [Bryobacteraceae bacterium]
MQKQAVLVFLGLCMGVANSLDVSDAQTRLAQARDNRVAALYRHNVARIDLAAAGTVQTFVESFAR